MTLCLIRLSQGQKTEAERYFLKAIQLDPTKGNCYMHYGKHHFISYFTFNLTYPDFILTSSNLLFVDLTHNTPHLCAQRQELLHFEGLYRQQCCLTPSPSLPLSSCGVSPYVISGRS